MKQFSPAGMAVKGFFGYRTKSLGNPDGAPRGGGAYSKGGANAQGPNQGGGAGGGPPGNTWVLGMTALGGATINGIASDGAGNTLAIDQNGVVYKSTNGGLTWINIAIVTNPGGGSNNGNLTFGNGVFVFARNPTLARVSSDGGLTWVQTPTFIPTAANRFGFAATDGVGNWLITSNAQVPANHGYSVSSDNATSFNIGANVSAPNFPNTPPLWDGAQFVSFDVAVPSIITSAAGTTWANTAANSNNLRWPKTYAGGYLTTAPTAASIRLGATLAALGAAADTVIPGLSGTTGVVGGNANQIFVFASGALVGFSANGGGTFSTAASNFTAGDSAVCLCFDSFHGCFIAGGFNGGVITNI